MGIDNLSGKKKYNNGKIAKYFYPGTQPDGWVLGNTKEKNIKNSEAQKKKWQKEEFVEKQKKTRSTKEYRDKISQINKDAWRINRESWSLSLKIAANKRFESQEEHIRCSDRMKEKWANEDYHKEMSIKLAESRKNMYDLHPEYRTKLSEKLTLAWENNKENILLKQYATKSKNNTWKYSSLEDEYYNELIEKYGKEDVVRQYYDKERYPFKCDFYIKSEDLFIELQGTWTHGPHPFDANNPDDIKLLEEWKDKSKTSDYYKKAIEVWTIKDVEKISIANKNNLNIKFIY